MTFSQTRFAGWYLLAQGLAICGWWLCLWRFPAARDAFVPPRASELELIAFALPDLAVAAPASLVAGVAALRRYGWAVPLAWLTSGAVVYAFLYCVAWSWLREGGWAGVVLMAPAALLSTVAAIDVSGGSIRIFRRASAATPPRYVAATLGQVAVFWSFFLGVVPAALFAVETRLGWPRFVLPGQAIIAIGLLVAWSVLGLASGMTMAAQGAGTPLPFAAPNRLVAAGPYAHVRNPMVIAGLGQGIAVGIWLGSWIVIAYVLLGGLIWHFLVRPAEEQDLLELFGDDYRAYRAEVLCWIPRVRPFQRESAAIPVPPGTALP